MKNILSFAFGPCLCLLLTSGGVQAQDGGFIKNLKGHTLPIQSLEFSPDSRYLLSGGGQPKVRGELYLWDVDQGELVQDFGGQHPIVMDVAIQADGRKIYRAGGYNSSTNFKVWQSTHAGLALPPNAQSRHITQHAAVSSIDLNADGSLLASGGLDKMVRIWDGNRFNLLNTLQGHKEQITEVSLSPDGRYVASASANYGAKVGEIILWDARTGRLIKKLGSKPGSIMAPVNSLDFSPDGLFLLSGGEDGSLIFWNVQTGELHQDLSRPYSQVSRVRYNQDGKLIAVANHEGVIQVWETITFQKLGTLRGHFKGVKALAFSPDGQFLASAGDDLNIRIWKALSNRNRVSIYVQEKMNTWQKRGKFEKSEEYLQRMSDANRQDKLRAFTQEAIDKIALAQIDWTMVQSKYDPDNETFQINFARMNPIYLDVPIDEAPQFDQNLKAVRFENPHFTLTPQDEFVLLKADVQNPSLSKTYHFNSRQFYAFNPQELDLSFDPIALNTDNFSPAPNNTRQDTRTTTTSSTTGRNSRTNVGISDVDYQLPKSNTVQPHAVAVVIGNRSYQKTKEVKYAIRDSRSVRNYLIDVMGFKPGNIIYLENASYTDFKLIFGSKENPRGKLFNTIKPGLSDVFVFYSGHGAPGLKDQKAYFVPTEADPQYVELTGFPADVFYNNLAKLPAKSVVVALDACFSGVNVFENISPIVIKSKGALGLKNGALLASSKADQVSSWYNEKGHGMFTYFFLKAIHNQNGDLNGDKKLTLQEIYQFIASNTDGIPYQARRIHGVEQNPVLKGQNPDKVIVNYE